MSYNIKSISQFDKQLKRLVKKYPSFKSDFFDFVIELKTNPIQGTSLGNNCYKIRIAISSKGKGKSGGARIITNLQVMDNLVFLLTIYDKSEQSDITDKDLQALLKKIIK